MTLLSLAWTGPLRRSSCALLMLIFGHAMVWGADSARAEWIRIRDSDVTVWSEIGALYAFRLVRVRESSKSSMYLLADCASKKITVIATQGTEETPVSDSWDDYPIESNAGLAAGYGCEHAAKEPGEGTWIEHQYGSTDNRLGAKYSQWSRIGALGSFRLTEVRLGDLPEIWAIHCGRRAIKPVGRAVPNSSDRTLLHQRWRNVNGLHDAVFVDHACKKRQ